MIILKGIKHLNSFMGFFGKSKEEKIAKFKEKQSEKFWNAVDYNKQFDFPVEYYERKPRKS